MYDGRRRIKLAHWNDKLSTTTLVSSLFLKDCNRSGLLRQSQLFAVIWGHCIQFILNGIIKIWDVSVSNRNWMRTRFHLALDYDVWYWIVSGRSLSYWLEDSDSFSVFSVLVLKKGTWEVNGQNFTAGRRPSPTVRKLLPAISKLGSILYTLGAGTYRILDWI